MTLVELFELLVKGSMTDVQKADAKALILQLKKTNAFGNVALATDVVHECVPRYVEGGYVNSRWGPTGNYSPGHYRCRICEKKIREV